MLIVYSKTGGGHKASADALASGIKSKLGNGVQVDIVDLWSDHTFYPFNQIPRSYSFAVAHPYLWRITYGVTNPRVVHVPFQAFCGKMNEKFVHKAFD